MIIIIAAVAENNAIGKDNELPWHLPEDMRLFREKTSGNTVIMGRKTYESIGRPLPNRNNIVVSRSLKKDDVPEGVELCGSLDHALSSAAGKGRDVFIMGGQSIYEQAMHLADRLYISHVKKKVRGDAFFPEIGEEWGKESEKDMGEFVFTIYRRKQ